MYWPSIEPPLKKKKKVLFYIVIFCMSSVLTHWRTVSLDVTFINKSYEKLCLWDFLYNGKVVSKKMTNHMNIFLIKWPLRQKNYLLETFVLKSPDDFRELIPSQRRSGTSGTHGNDVTSWWWRQADKQWAGIGACGFHQGVLFCRRRCCSLRLVPSKVNDAQSNQFFLYFTGFTSSSTEAV